MNIEFALAIIAFVMKLMIKLCSFFYCSVDTGEMCIKNAKLPSIVKLPASVKPPNSPGGSLEIGPRDLKDLTGNLYA
jgi:hypothetical protein